MEFLTLSLPEAVYLYTGLALQLLLRQSSLRWLPGVIVVCYTVALCTRVPRGRAHWADVPVYVFCCLVICILFWPEATIFGRRQGRITHPDQVASYAAQQDQGASVVTAQDTQQVPQWANIPVLLPDGLRLTLRPITELPLALARAINSQAHRTFATIMPMHWLLGLELTTEVTTAISDWVHNCYVPALTVLQARQQGRTVEELLPWENSVLRQELSTRQVVPGAQTGITWIGPPRGLSVLPQQVRCDTYLDAVEFRTQAWLFELKSPAGAPLSDVFAQELGLDALQQARFVLYREMLKAAGPLVPAPSLTGQYAALRAAGALGDLVGGLKPSGSALSALTGAAAGEFQRAIDGLSWLVGMAVFLTWWGPYILGVVQMLMLALFPFVVLWALIPQNHLQPLVLYFVGLLFAFFWPLWWALVDEAAKLAATQAPSGGSLIIGTLTGAMWSTMVTAIGILLVPVITGVVLFLSFRSLGGMWRGTTL